MKKIQPFGNKVIHDVLIERFKQGNNVGFGEIRDEVKAEMLVYFKDVDALNIAANYKIPSAKVMEAIEKIQSSAEMRELIFLDIDIYKPLHSELDRLTAEHARLL